MLKNYFKIAIRNLLRNKIYSFINIFGLAVGLSSAMLILLLIADEMSYDLFHPKKNVLYKAWNRGVFDGKLNCWYVTPSPLGPALKKEFPEIKETSRVDWTYQRLLKVGEKFLMVKGTVVDKGFLTMFGGFQLVRGKPEKALEGVYSIVITESLASKLFDKQDPMGKTIRVDNIDNFMVSGIIKDLPKNTEFDFEYLLPWEYYKKKGWEYDFWGNNSYQTYVELQPHANIEEVNRKIRDITIRNSNKTEETEVFLHPVSKWRLYSKFENGKIVGGRIEYIRLFAIIAVSILVIACINFMNLATARSEKRVKEVGIRKVVGAMRESLIGQFLGESIMIAFLAFILAIILTELALPWFNLLTEKKLAIYYSNPIYWLLGIGFTLFTGLLAGSYPAFYLSSFQPVKVLKGTFKNPKSVINPRKVLVVVQFTFSIGLIISTIIVYQQIEYARNRDNGYDKKNLVFHSFTGDIEKNYELIKAELLKNRIAKAVCKTNAPITNAQSNTWGISWKGKNPKEKILFDQITCTEDFTKTMGIQLIEGRDIDTKTFKTDTSACIINETAAKIMRLENVVGENIQYDNTQFKIVGVFKDFIWGSPYRPVQPMFVRGVTDWYNVITFRLDSQLPVEKQLQKAEAVFKKFNPYFPFEYKFVDAEYDKKFKAERLIGTLAYTFTILTVIISCLGLFGLAAYTAEQRTKEIGIRKVMGATVSSIMVLLSKDFLRLVMISFIITAPITWWLMEKWLSTYQYRVSVGWSVFAFAGIIALLIAILTVVYQAFKAALANPVECLRYE